MEKDGIIKAFAVCPEEMTEALAEEIRGLGAEQVETAFRAVYFQCGKRTLYRMHSSISLGSRIGIILKEIPAQRPEIIFDKTRRIRFHEYFDASEALRITVHHDGRSDHIETHLIGSKIREAINDSFMHFKGVMPQQSSRDALLGLNGFLKGRRLLLSLDSSGESLHRRGYRLEGHPAPLKEHLADLMLHFAGYDGSRVIYDPMCGSGTLILEAARIASGMAPLKLRQTAAFGLSRLKNFDPRLWKEVQRELEKAEQRPPAGIYGSDLEEAYVRMAESSAATCGLSDHIKLFQADFFKQDKPAETGLLVMNIPYGERLSQGEEGAGMLKRMGDHLKQRFGGWSVCIMMPAELPEGALGLRIGRKMRMSNGPIPVKLVYLDIY